MIQYYSKNTSVFFQKIATAFLLLFFLFQNRALFAQSYPSGFSQVKVVSLQAATAMCFAPDGRLFVCTKDGTVRIVKNGALLNSPFLTLTVDQNGERGISGITFDPNFNSNHYVYIYYTATSPTIHNRLSRFTANGDAVVAGSEFTLLDAETVINVFHNGGGLGFGPDGKLYLSMGEDNKPNNAQNLGTYKGKLLRLNADGSAPSDNPYHDSPSQITKRIWGLGLRNPYTLAFQPGTGKLFVNNVGADSFEEINDGTQPGKNFGWPDEEGNGPNPAYTDPVFAYPHEAAGQHGCAVTGGAFFNPVSTNYPNQYTGKYFYMDYCNGWMHYLTLGNPATTTSFSSGMGTKNLALRVGPDGNLYFLSRDDARAGVYKIIYSNNNAPVISSQPASITVPEGQPATFSVSATGALPLSYQWKKNGVNIAGATSSSYTIAHTQQSDAGQYRVTVSNNYGSATSNNATLTVSAFNASPAASILIPSTGTYYHAGDVIQFSGNGTDPEEGTLPAQAFEWVVEFHHNNNHFHPGPAIQPGIKSGSFTIPNTGESSPIVFYRLKLVVRDSQGLTDTATVDIQPVTSNITLNTQPAGLRITYDSQPQTAPFSILAVEGMNIPIGVVSPQNVGGQGYAFDHWQHGGPASQTIVIGAGDSSYTAYYKDTVMTCMASGTIFREYWANVQGDHVSQIPVNSPPTSTSYLTLFEGPKDIGDNYGARIKGFVCPPQSGNYSFWIASNNDAELWLSTDANPQHKVKIASVTGWTNPREWTKYPSQHSMLINLVAGSSYYIEALHKDGLQGDHVSVGWELPSGSMERPIPGSRLSPDTTHVAPAPNAQLIAANASWKYLDNGSNQGTGWRAKAFNDGTWKTGNAELGYGDGGEATVVSYGGNASNKYITTYFRKSFNVADANAFTGLELSLVRDDGAVVYLNGTEVYRNNMPGGSIYYNSLAPNYIDGANESAWLVANISKSSLVTGTNVIAVEIHQNSHTSSDISFNLKLKGLSGAGKKDNDEPLIADTSSVANANAGLPADNAMGALMVYPNPNSGQFNLEFCMDDVNEKTMSIEIMSPAGQVVYKKEPVKINGCVREVISLDKSLAAGIYIMNVNTDGMTESRRILLTD